MKESQNNVEELLNYVQVQAQAELDDCKDVSDIKLIKSKYRKIFKHINKLVFNNEDTDVTAIENDLFKLLDNIGI